VRGGAEKHEHELHDLQRAHKKLQERSTKREDKIAQLEFDKNVLERAYYNLELKVEKMSEERRQDEQEKNRVKELADQNQQLERIVGRDESVIAGLVERAEAAEGELERMKRKREDSRSPERTITSILKRQETVA
jgi:hypothetical protein